MPLSASGNQLYADVAGKVDVFQRHTHTLYFAAMRDLHPMMPEHLYPYSRELLQALTDISERRRLSWAAAGAVILVDVGLSGARDVADNPALR